MKKISQEDQKKILSISKRYLEIHQNIGIVEKKMKDLEEISSKLIEELQDCREDEDELMKKMQKKYGSGKFNPLNFCWEK